MSANFVCESADLPQAKRPRNPTPARSLILTSVKRPLLLQPDRLKAVVIYTVLFLVIGRVVGGQLPPPADLGGLWFYVGVAALLLGTFLQEPFYSTPADALLNGVALLVTMIGLTPDGAQVDAGVVQLGRVVFIAYAVVVIGLATVAIGLKDEGGPSGLLAAASARGARLLGSGAVLYSVVFFAASYAAFARESGALAALYLTWIVLFQLAPVERALAFAAKARNTSAFGVVEKVLDPGILVVRGRPGANVEVGMQLEIGTPPRDGVVVSVTSLLGEPRVRVAMAARAAVRVGSEVRPKVAPLIPSVVGFTDIGTTLSELKVELVPGGAKRGLEIGRLLEVIVAERPTLYQIVSAEIDEDSERDHIRTPSHAVATKIGRWNEERSTFELEPWVPEPGSPAALVAVVRAAFESKYLGHVPDTAYGVGINVHAAVTHNTAILGILGVGKTTLAWELIRRMLAEGIKVVVLDITGKYAPEFADLCAPETQQNHEQTISERIVGRLNDFLIVGADAGNAGDFDAALRELIGRFMRGPARLLILNPSRFEVSRSGSGVNFKDTRFALTLARVSAVDITRRVSQALLEFVQGLPEPQDEKARLCLVMEEAHSLVPEWNSTTQDEERDSVNGTVRAVLQGRKYGYGCLLITQRTANVTKSILNQCNTILGMRVYDTTGMGFLENYIGEAHSKVLASLKNRQAVFFGRASTCEAPIVLQLNEARAFRDDFWTPLVDGISTTPVFDELERAAPRGENAAAEQVHGIGAGAVEPDPIPDDGEDEERWEFSADLPEDDDEDENGSG